MTWAGVVWREAGPYGPGGTFVPQVRLGRYSLPVKPEAGNTLEVDDEKYWVVSVAGRFCHVRGGSANAIGEVSRGHDPGGSSPGSLSIRWRAAGLGTT